MRDSVDARDSGARNGKFARVRLTFADRADREEIYRMRHAVYASELGQHSENLDRRLTDELDAFNHYLVARVGNQLGGFVSITPPGHGRYSIDKYFARSDLPFSVDDGLFEVRILTVDRAFRRSILAGLLMYGAFRWSEDHGATRIVGIGRHEILPLYERAGLRPLGITIRSGAVRFELIAATVAELRAANERFAKLAARASPGIEWSLSIPMERRPGAFHGGASHSHLGAQPSPEARAKIISADVLDAWFPPSPGVLSGLSGDLAFLSMSSPPTYAVELQRAIAAARGVNPSAIVPGAGLSDLIFRALTRWVRPGARVLLVEPLYGEYAHVLVQYLGCQLNSLTIDPAMGGFADPATLSRHLERGYDLVVLVEPNNPAGYRFPPGALLEILARAPKRTLIWVDETYVDFAEPQESLESFAARSENVVIGKSMSKAYALSGLRVGYLCGPSRLAKEAWAVTPPWNISRPAQVAAIAALGDPGYYAERYRETAGLRQDLEARLALLPGVRPRRGVANFVLCEFEGIDAPTVVELARRRGLFLRDFPTDPALRWRAIRIAVGDGRTNDRVIGILEKVLEEHGDRVPAPVARTGMRAAVAAVGYRSPVAEP